MQALPFARAPPVWLDRRRGTPRAACRTADGQPSRDPATAEWPGPWDGMLRHRPPRSSDVLQPAQVDVWLAAVDGCTIGDGCSRKADSSIRKGLNDGCLDPLGKGDVKKN